MNIRSLKQVFLILLFSHFISYASALNSCDSISERVLVFDMGDDGSRFYRIPALITAADGSLVAVADKRWDKMNDLPARIDVVVRRSTDNGHTWSPIVTIASDDTTGCGDAALVLNKINGEILCIFASGNGLWQSNYQTPMRINISRSKDNGRTWSNPYDITDQIYGPGCQNEKRKKWYGAFAASGKALQTRDGRIMFVIAVRTTPEWGGPISNYVCYSDDGGTTWNVSKNAADTNGDEAKLVELDNGDILMSIRNRAQGERKFCLSQDKGVTWGKPYLQKEIQDPACNGDILRYASVKDGDRRSILLHSIPDDPKIRRNVSILASFDEGHTWPLKRIITPGYSAYSSMTVLRDGSIGILVEEGKWDNNLPGKDGFELWFIRLTPDWLYPNSLK